MCKFVTLSPSLEMWDDCWPPCTHGVHILHFRSLVVHPVPTSSSWVGHRSPRGGPYWAYGVHVCPVWFSMSFWWLEPVIVFFGQTPTQFINIWVALQFPTWLPFFVILICICVGCSVYFLCCIFIYDMFISLNLNFASAYRRLFADLFLVYQRNFSCDAFLAPTKIS